MQGGRPDAERYMVYVSESRKDREYGGLGDRLIGLAATKIFAEGLGRRFLVWWIGPDVSGAVAFAREYDYASSSVFPTPGKSITTLDFPIPTRGRPEEDLHALRRLARTDWKRAWASVDVVLVWSNLCYQQALFANPHLSGSYGESLRDATLRVYGELFSEILVPTAELRSAIASPISSLVGRLSVGIHLRFGDRNIPNLDPVYANDLHGQTEVEPIARGCFAKILPAIDRIREGRGAAPEGTCVVLLSDSADATLQAVLKSALPEGTQVLTVDGPVVHLQRSATSDAEPAALREGILKVFADMLLFSACDVGFFQRQSNFGRVASLIAGERQERWVLSDREWLPYFDDEDVPTRIDDPVGLFPRFTHCLRV